MCEPSPPLLAAYDQSDNPAFRGCGFTNLAEQSKAGEIEQETQARIQTTKAEQGKLLVEFGRAKAGGDQLRTDSRMGTGGAPALWANGV